MKTTSEQKIINQVKMLCAEAVQKANSGHPGMPLGSAPIAYALFQHFLKFHSQDPQWINRDRFVLSAGHASSLLYSFLHLYGYAISLDDLKAFRQWGSITAGHPEFDTSRGIEMSTGPLGAGAASSVGMAMAERLHREKFGSDIIDHRIIALVSDGDLMEGISYEAASIAGHQKLSHLYWIYDSNAISIEGSTDDAFTENIEMRFQAQGWHVLKTPDAQPQTILSHLEQLSQNAEKPKLLIVPTTIGEGAFEKAGSAGAHGAPLGDAIVKRMRSAFGYPADTAFYQDPSIQNDIDARLQALKDQFEQWQSRYNDWMTRYPERALELKNWQQDHLAESWWQGLCDTVPESEATRASCGKILNHLAQQKTNIIGGSADLSPSTKTSLKDSDTQQAMTPTGRNIAYGVREHAMGAICNGMAVYGGLRPFCSTFLVFSDYMRYAIRLAAFMECPSLFIFSHDSIYVGEDGPTHQPIEHVDSLRLIPNLAVIRPADFRETIAAFDEAMQRKGATVIITTRQNLPAVAHSKPDRRTLSGYYARPAATPPRTVLYASGSEVGTAIAAAELLSAKGIETAVVSIASMASFEALDKKQRQTLLPTNTYKVGIEAGTGVFLRTFTDDVVNICRYGASAPAATIANAFGFNAEKIAANIEKRLEAQ